jgi:hypothetical protein
MRYQKPDMSTAAALESIQHSTNKTSGEYIDANLAEYNATKPAYEADE